MGGALHARADSGAIASQQTPSASGEQNITCEPVMIRGIPFRKRILLLLLLASAAGAQSLPPEVILLARIKSHLREELSRMPNYTCLETISRFRGAPHAQLKPLDRVRLEIVYSNHQEYFGSPGDREIGVDDPRAFIGGGMIGNGLFAMTLNNILEGGQFTYRGDELVAGRSAVRYDFHIPGMYKGLVISVPGGSGTVGEDGSIWVDRSSLDTLDHAYALARITAVATEIPPSLPISGMTTDVSYARTRIGEHTVLLAQQADIDLSTSNGLEDFDRFEFTHCRAYSAESQIRFDTEPGRAAEYMPQSSAMPLFRGLASESIPALLAVTVQITTPITQSDSVGTLIRGKVSGDVTRKGKIVIPDGSVVRGRIRRFEQHETGKAFIVGLEFTEIDVRGRSIPFYADLLRIEKNPLIKPALSERVFVHRAGRIQVAEETINLHELPGVASFFVTGQSFRLPVGFRMVWRTRGPIRGIERR